MHSFKSLVRDLATIAKNRIQPKAAVDAFDMITRPTALQQRAIELLGIRLYP